MQVDLQSESSLVHKKWYKTWWGGLILAFLAISVTGLLWFIYMYIDVTATIMRGEYDSRLFGVEDSVEFPLDTVLFGDEPVIGSLDAPITIVEFGDFLCPRCFESYTVMRELSLKYPDKLIYYWKHFPIIDVTSVEYAKAAECANQQDLFWPFHDRLFQGQGVIAPNQLSNVAVQVGLDPVKYQSCFNNPKTLLTIQRDFEMAETIEASGTPTFIVNGIKVEGHVPAQVWEDILSKLE